MTIICLLIFCWFMIGAVITGNIILDENEPGQTIGKKLMAFGIMFAFILASPFLFIYNKITHKLW